MPNTDFLVEDEKGFYFALLYLKSEAQRSKMTNTEQHLNRALDSIIEEIDFPKEIIADLHSARVFIERTMRFNAQELAHLLDRITFSEKGTEDAA